ncbi:interleukin-23 receptor isoform X1 [Ictalurus furcatus]|uniref:interleukin-23 receptor isoform X1 n=1 Tax=Ictalurus furcatus TaxID=66913 RepID=UPI002350355F|nr:interleukin-23 receptor isoform X1 [Ictalurus furcatus]XP_053492573.1 interleukin-23 receptor isoform X1 [Ictalurus furcatus]XP_053492574.1 interleukin-23 receptor isoform X1 [Ictalurus furcatus]XP_053492575.1 interleukin-23 receptor isoform X1 [Ictalurus furcatus]
MDIFTEALRLVLLLLFNCKLRVCYIVACTGELTVDQDVIPIGSNLTVHCRSNTEKCGRIFIMKFNDKEILRKTSCSSVTAQVVVNEPKFSITCSEQQGRTSRIVCGRDIVANPIPSPPQIKEIAFTKGSLSPTIHWHSSDNMENLTPSLRFRTQDTSRWMEGNVTQLHRGTLTLLGNLEPLTLYQFELRVCTASVTYNCSLWSQLLSMTSPGKAPSTKLDVWRVIMRNEDTQNVTVMWKPLGTEVYKGVLHHYEIVYQEKGTTHILNCSRAVTQYTLQLPLEVTELNVSAVTSAGSSPPASVKLTCSAGIPSPEIKSSHAAGGGINLVWDSPHFSDKTSEQMLGFVVQWQCTPLQVQWKRNEKSYNSVYIHAPEPTLCNISLYVESSDGVSCPSFKQIHTIKKGLEENKSVPVTEVLKVESAPGRTKDRLVGICLITAIPIIIIVNLMYLKCTRQRIRKVFVSVGPSWLFQNLPKLGNSNAIKLLKDERCGSDLCWQPMDNDPPLSPVEDYSPPLERKDSYPIAHKEVTTEERMVVQDWTVCPYKPQIMISQGAEAECEVAEKEEDEPPWVDFSSPVFNMFEQHFLPSQGMCAPLPSCLTVDGRPVSMDLVDGFPFFTPTAFDGNMLTNDRPAETGNGEQNKHQCQTVLPSNLMRCLREPFF